MHKIIDKRFYFIIVLFVPTRPDFKIEKQFEKVSGSSGFSGD